MGAVYGVERPTWPLEQFLGGFSSSYWWAFAALWWPHSPHARGAGGRKVRAIQGSRQWFILPPCHSLQATLHKMASELTVLGRKIRTVFLSVALIHPFCACCGFALCVLASQCSPITIKNKTYSLSIKHLSHYKQKGRNINMCLHKRVDSHWSL